MIDVEKVISCLTDIENIMITRQEICPREELQYWIELQEGVADALVLLKEQKEEQERVVRIINETLHDGFSLDQNVDQDYVCEVLVHRIYHTNR